MTQTPIFNDAEFLGATQLTKAANVVFAGQEEDLALTHSAGLINGSSYTASVSTLTVTYVFGSTFAALFSNGFLAKAHGATAGTDTQTYAVNLSSFVPSSGTSTVYLVLSGSVVSESAFTVSGPPSGHPDYDSTFAPYTAYASAYNSFTLTATTTAPNNTTSLEFARITLSAGQTSVLTTQFVYTNQVMASSILDGTGVTAGAYSNANVTVGADGRITAIAAGAGNLLNEYLVTSSSTYTPSAGTRTTEFLLVGGGGGGGGVPGIGTNTPGYGVAAGGGGSGGIIVWRGPASSISGATLTIGNAGAGGVAGINTGNAGGATAVVLSGVISISALGGNGGSSSTALAQFVGCPSGSGGGASISLAAVGAVLFTGSGVSGDPGLWAGYVGGSLISGKGGGSLFGGGTNSVANTSPSGAGSYGAGGAGASVSTTDSASAPGYNGGAGHSGVILVREYT